MAEPLQALISHQTFLDGGGTPGLCSQGSLSGASAGQNSSVSKFNLCRILTSIWITLTSLRHPRHHYENLRQNLVLEMRGILDYLGIRQDPSRLSALSEKSRRVM
ncbi:hypothetical protein GWK47_008536 [Chionoecetes opilio]|uniref:Uncharacterized protein n=1 Tax=Chionoecetes opilio TaxID=41210 RepID=A0A8J5CP44_CHIOP|nr:hypothetical protein GWK47_008536 [Chionoecetes opilio]